MLFMKHLYLVLLAASISLAGRAQIDKGDILLGGNLGFQSLRSSSTSNVPISYPTNSTELSINPSFGKAIKNNTVAGFDLTYGHTSYNQGPGQESNSENTYGGGVFIRRYRPLGNGFYLFGQARLGGSYDHIGYSNQGTSPGNPTAETSSTTSFSFSLFPGIAYALNRHWQVETGLPNFLSIDFYHQRQYTGYATASEQVNTTNDFDLSSALTGNNEFSVGVKYIIGN